MWSYPLQAFKRLAREKPSPLKGLKGQMFARIAKRHPQFLVALLSRKVFRKENVGRTPCSPPTAEGVLLICFRVLQTRLAENGLRYDALAQSARLRNDLLRAVISEGRK